MEGVFLLNKFICKFKDRSSTQHNILFIDFLEIAIALTALHPHLPLIILLILLLSTSNPPPHSHFLSHYFEILSIFFLHPTPLRILIFSAITSKYCPFSFYIQPPSAFSFSQQLHRNTVHFLSTSNPPPHSHLLSHCIEILTIFFLNVSLSAFP